MEHKYEENRTTIWRLDRSLSPALLVVGNLGISFIEATLPNWMSEQLHSEVWEQGEGNMFLVCLYVCLFNFGIKYDLRVWIKGDRFKDNNILFS